MSDRVTALTLAQFLAWEEGQPKRQLVDGCAYATSGGTERQALMAGQLSDLLSPATRAASPPPDGAGLVV